MKAFPLVSPDGVGVNEGMELRDYFAAHAPKAAKWFTVELPPYPTLGSRPVFDHGAFPDLDFGNTVKRFGDPDWGVDYQTAEGCVALTAKWFKSEWTESLRHAVQSHADALFAWYDADRELVGAIDAWRIEQDRRISAQWPFAWADLILAEREHRSLIHAAAQDLYDAITASMEYLDGTIGPCEPGCDCVLHALHAAIAKAEGRS